MKTLMEDRGIELLDHIPHHETTGKPPVVQLDRLSLDDGNCWQYPTLLLGNVGSGKSTLMRRIMEPVFAYATTATDNVVTFAAKPDMLRDARPGDAVISVNNLAAASCWNIFEELAASADPELTLREISISLFAEQEKHTTQPFFAKAARDIFYNTCLYMYDYARINHKTLNNADLVEFLTTTPVTGSAEIPGWKDLAKRCPDYFGMVRDYIGNGSEQGLGVLSELRLLISSTFYGSFAAEGSFSAIRTLRTGGKRIFLYYDYANSGHSSLVLLKIILDLLLKEAMNVNSSRKTWFFLDEASLLPRSEVLTDALSFGRDPSGKGNSGIRIMMALQSARLLTNQYTKEEAECLLSLFPNVIAMRVSDPMSRAVVADRYGKAHYQFTYAGIGEKVNYTDNYEDVVSDQQFCKITKPGQCIMSLPGISNQPFVYDGYKGG